MQLQKALLCGLFVCLAVVCAYHEFRTVPSTPVVEGDHTVPEPHDPLTARSWGIFDPETGTLIASHDADTIRPIASVTKLFTGVVVMESDIRDTVFTIAPSDVATEGRAGSVQIGDRVTPYSLLFPLLIESSNDAAAAIERMFGASAYLQSVASLRDTLSLSNTTITEASGLDAGNLSTVHDLALLFSYIMRTHSHLLDISQLPVFIGDGVEYHNNDPAREFDSFAGGKHGYTTEAGRTFVGMFILPQSGASVGIVLLGSTDLRSDIAGLFSLGEALVSSGILLNTTHTP